MAFYELKEEFYDVWLILDQFRVDPDSKKCDLFFKLDSCLHNREPILPEQTIKRLQTLALSVTQQMASKKHPFFEYLLSFFYRGKWGCPANHQESFDFANRSSLQNNSWGYCGLGYCYDCGIGIPADQKKAVVTKLFFSTSLNLYRAFTKRAQTWEIIKPFATMPFVCNMGKASSLIPLEPSNFYKIALTMVLSMQETTLAIATIKVSPLSSLF